MYRQEKIRTEMIIIVLFIKSSGNKSSSIWLARALWTLSEHVFIIVIQLAIHSPPKMSIWFPSHLNIQNVPIHFQVRCFHSPNVSNISVRHIHRALPKHAWWLKSLWVETVLSTDLTREYIKIISGNVQFRTVQNVFVLELQPHDKVTINFRFSLRVSVPLFW